MAGLALFARRAISAAAFATMFVGLLLLASPGSARAHASLVKSDPPRRAQIDQAPPELRLWFNEAIEAAFADIVVLDEKGATVAAGKGSVSKDEPKRVNLKLPALGPGKYTVKYKVLSVDGHVVDWSFMFTVKRGAERR